MASMYGGQGANAAVKGYQQGYKFQQDSETAMQEAQLRSEKIKQAGLDNELREMSVDNVRLKQQEEIKTLQKAQTTTNSTIVKSDINNITLQSDSKDREQFIGTLQTKFKTNPEIYKMLGIKNPQTMSILNPRDSKDREWMESTLIKEGLKVEDYGDNWDAMITETMDAYPAMKADGAIVDLNGLSAATGSAVMATPQYNKIMEKNRNELKARQENSLVNMENAMKADLGGEGSQVPYNERADKPLTDPTAKTFEDRNKLMAMGDDVPEEERADMTDEDIANKRAYEDIEKTSQAASASFKEVRALMDGHETGNSKSYTAKNKNTGAYGRYQFMPQTMASLQKRLGLERTDTPSSTDQDAMYEELVNEHRNDLKSIGAPDTAENLYALHQLGGPTGKNYLKGNITPKVISSMKNQFSAKKTDGKSDQEIVNMWEKRFANGGGGTVTQQITNEIKSSGDNGQPLNDMRMRKIYALLGKSYPKDPNEATVKMKNFDFLSEKVGEKQAMEAIFGSTGSPGRMEKAIKFLRTLEPGTKEYKAQENYIKKLGRSGTASKFDRDEAITANKKLDAKGTENWTKEDKTDYASNNEVIQGYDKTAKEQNREADRADRVRADDMLIESATEVEESRRTGKPLSATTREKLKSAEQIKRAAQTDLAKADDKKLEEMNGKRRAANSTASFINRVTDGDLAKDYDKDIVANPISWVQNLFGSENEKTQSALQKKATAAIKANTRLGIIQANYIKSMSGTAASDAERQFLTEIMMGDSWGDETALMTAITEFYDSQVEDIQDYNIAVSPAQEHRAKQVDRIRRDSRTEKEGSPDTWSYGDPLPSGYKVQSRTVDGTTEHKLVKE